MPTYQYQCTECGTGLEAVQKFTDDALTTCPECQGRLRKVFSAVGVVFKGSGFYRTDSRSSSSSSVSPASSSTPSTPAASTPAPAASSSSSSGSTSTS
ncbi:FmdB family zinc ribbon protein [Kitasatospora sp. NPDC002040]|uniref:FmdB family zinc ribbon protein n=1 Tax=Kitasatospora sp. NPDC002040 TaxID=3154661 RepID=UPI003316FB55